MSTNAEKYQELRQWILQRQRSLKFARDMDGIQQARIQAEEEILHQINYRKWDIREDHIWVFLRDKEGFAVDPLGTISSGELYEIYCRWCKNEHVSPEGLRALSWRLKHREVGFPVREITLTRNGRRCRGFRGIRAVTDDTDNA